jgi:hypothetical protein
MNKRKFSEYSSVEGSVADEKDICDFTITNNSKKRLHKEEMIKTYCRIRPIENNPGN